MLSRFEASKLKPLNRKWLIGIGIACLIGIGLITLRLKSSIPTAPAPISPPPTLPTVNALGRLEPEGEVIKVSAPSQFMGGSQVMELRVKEGDVVQAGQILAVLDSRDRLQSSLLEAQKQVQVYRSRLEDVKAGAKRGEITAAQAEIQNLEAQLSGEVETQQATIDRLQAELENAEKELQRNQILFEEGAIAASVLDTRKLAVITAQKRLKEATSISNRTQGTLTAQIQKAKAILSQTAEVQSTEISIAKAEVDRAIAAVKRIQTELNQSYVRAPKSGRILKIQTYEGEITSSDGIVELAATDQMIVIAEVYESDIKKVQKGQTAIITSPSNVFSNKILGIVQQIGSQIAKKDILNSDPTAATDARVIEVKIQLDREVSKKVANLINLQVDVELQP